MDYNHFVSLIRSHLWMPAVIFVVGYLVRLTSDDSKFPATFPRQWHAPLVVFLVWLYTFLKEWPDWLTGLDLPMLSALAILVLKAVFHGREPAWFTWLAIVPRKDVADITKKSG